MSQFHARRHQAARDADIKAIGSGFHQSFRIPARPSITKRTPQELERIACEFAVASADTTRARGYRDWCAQQAELYAQESRFARMGIYL